MQGSWWMRVMKGICREATVGQTNSWARRRPYWRNETMDLNWIERKQGSQEGYDETRIEYQNSKELLIEEIKLSTREHWGKLYGKVVTDIWGVHCVVKRGTKLIWLSKENYYLNNLSQRNRQCLNVDMRAKLEAAAKKLNTGKGRNRYGSGKNSWSKNIRGVAWKCLQILKVRRRKQESSPDS